MFFLAFLVFVLAIFFGARIGGIGIAYASGLGLFILTMIFGMAPGSIPIDVVLIITAVIGAVAALEASGGLDLMVKIAERILRSNPKHINILAPVTSFLMTVLVGTSHSVYSLIPVIVQVAKEQNIKPVRPLAVAITASNLGITSSPIAAAMVAMTGFLEPFGITFPTMMMILLPGGLVSAILGGVIQSFRSQSLSDDKNYQELLKKGGFEEKADGALHKINTSKPYAKRALSFFLLGIFAIVVYSMIPSLKPLYASTGKSINTANLIEIVMLTVGLLIALSTKINISKISSQSTFKAGMGAVICVIGVAWLGDTLVANYKEEIKAVAGGFVSAHSWSFPIAMALVATLLYSQTATTVAIIPLGIALGLPPIVLLASFPAASTLCVLPTYPTVIAALQMDDTGTTKLGKYVFDHPFLIPGLLGILIAVVATYLFASILL